MEDSQIVGSQQRSASEHEQSDLVLSLATPDLYLGNPFRLLTGLATDAPRPEVRKHANGVRMQLKLDGADGFAKTALTLPTPPTEESIDAAVRDLAEPELRLVHELFWFWPARQHQWNSDEAVGAIGRNAIDEAERVWLAQAREPDDVGSAARHNLAVLHHLSALDLERASPDKWWTASSAERERRWKLAIEYWSACLRDRRTWLRLCARADELGDERVNAATVESLSGTLPLALTIINVQLGVRFGEQERLVETRRHRALVRAWANADARFDNAVDDAVRRGTAGLSKRLSALTDSSRTSVEEDSFHGDAASRKLLDETGPLLAILTGVSPEDDPRVATASDAVALAALECTVAYGNRTEDWQSCVTLLERMLPMARADATRRRLKESLESVQKNAKEGASWCAPGYTSLPPPVLSVLEKARKDVEGGRFEQAIAAVGNAMMGRGGAALTPHQTEVVQTSIAFAFNQAGNRTVGPALAAWNSRPDRLRDRVAERARAGKLDTTTMVLAQEDRPITQYEQVSCMACGAMIVSTFYRIKLNDKLKAIVCNSCSSEQDSAEEAAKGPLRKAVTSGLEFMTMAVAMAPGDEVYRKNLKSMQELATSVGRVATRSVAQLKVFWGLASTEDFIFMLFNPETAATAEAALSRAGAVVVPDLLTSPTAQANGAVLQRVLLGMGTACVDPIVAGWARWPESLRPLLVRLLGQIGDTRALDVIIQSMQTSGSAKLLDHIEALGRLRDARAAPILIEHLRSPGSPASHAAACNALGEIGSADAVEELLVALIAPDPTVGSAALAALDRIDATWPEIETVSELVPHLADGLTAPDPLARLHSAQVLARVGRRALSALDAIREAAADASDLVRVAVAATLASVQGNDAVNVELLVRLLGDAEPDVRVAAAKALGALGDSASVAGEPLAKAVGDRHERVRAAAEAALGIVAPALLGQVKAKQRRARLLKDGLRRVALFLVLPILLWLATNWVMYQGGDSSAAQRLAGYHLLAWREAVPVTIRSLADTGDTEDRNWLLQLPSNWRSLPATREALRQTVIKLAVKGSDADAERKTRESALLALRLMDENWAASDQARAGVKDIAARWTQYTPWTPERIQSLAELGPSAQPLLGYVGDLLSDSSLPEAVHLAALRLIRSFGPQAFASAVPSIRSALEGNGDHALLVAKTLATRPPGDTTSQVDPEAIETLGRLAAPEGFGQVTSRTLEAAAVLSDLGAQASAALPALMLDAQWDTDSRYEHAINALSSPPEPLLGTIWDDAHDVPAHLTGLLPNRGMEVSFVSKTGAVITVKGGANAQTKRSTTIGAAWTLKGSTLVLKSFGTRYGKSQAKLAGPWLLVDTVDGLWLLHKRSPPAASPPAERGSPADGRPAATSVGSASLAATAATPAVPKGEAASAPRRATSERPSAPVAEGTPAPQTDETPPKSTSSDSEQLGF